MWFRYIDDMLTIWTHGEDKLKGFLFYINSIHSYFQFICNYFKECVQLFDVSVSVDSTGNMTTDLYVKTTDTHKYLLATSCHPNHTKTNIQIEHAFTNFANHSTVRKSHTTRPVYFNVQLDPGLPDITGILQKYMPLLHQSVTMKTVVTDLPNISFSQPPNLCHHLCRAKLCQPPSVIDEPPLRSQSCGK